MTPQRNTSRSSDSFRLWWTLLLLPLLSGCGYAFPGAVAKRTIPGLESGFLIVSGPGTISSPLLSQSLKYQLKTRLGLQIADPDKSLDDVPHLLISLNRLQQDKLIEDSLGRADKYRVQITGTPTIKIPGTKPTVMPSITGETTYFESHESTTSLTLKKQAGIEAVEALIEKLLVQLTGNS
ncbi:MAG: hypothetical protein HQL50_00950 [Magnetococcales bacterium]|nr:hypothetical protein [Magnetococcales bacterium]